MSEKLTKDDIIALYTIFMRRYVKFASIYLFLVAIGPIADYISMYLKNFTISIIIGEASIGIISVYYITLLLKSAPLIKLSRLFFGSKNMLIYSLLKAILLVIYFLINTFLPYYNVFLFETIAMPLIPIFLILPPGSPAINRFNRTIYKLSIIYILFSPIYYFSGITNSFLIISLLLIAGGIYIAIRQG
ncbi:hypothetical protein [Acidianus sp. HS-5]|uniref:hypothetical protein n=1 Tax=Acidianus sp. HS-5 TaxID=2886040 RepID=UPI001F21B673|nr:hypothetical protein [Acidianus sp. HS-5]